MCVQLEDFQSEGVGDCVDIFGNLGILYETEIRYLDKNCDTFIKQQL